jgi:hypothetical protein
VNNYTGAAPDTQRATDWRDAAACRDEDAELFFPVGATPAANAQTRHAKVICSGCPVLQACGAWALATRQAFGVWGGMSEAERRGLLRQAARRNLTPDEVKAGQTRRPVKPRTMQSIFDDNTVRLYGGHLAWTGPRKVSFRGKTYTPRQLCFTLDRGHTPNGPVTADCRSQECHLPAHLIDSEGRARCGTRPGYQRHLKLGQTPCPPCRQANADADNRLRRTGSTKALA